MDNNVSYNDVVAMKLQFIKLVHFTQIVKPAAKKIVLCPAVLQPASTGTSRV